MAFVYVIVGDTFWSSVFDKRGAKIMNKYGIYVTLDPVTINLGGLKV
jgi:hypothetical protein